MMQASRARFSDKITQINVNGREDDRQDHDGETDLEVIQERDLDTPVSCHAGHDEIGRGTD